MTTFPLKVTTTFRDNGKVNQIVPIMQEHLDCVMNLARIKLLAFMIHAPCVVQTVSLHKIAAAMPTSVERDSNLRRLQRFLAHYPLKLDLIARIIFALLPVKTGLVLTMDRTNWKFGEVNINILMLGVTHKGIARLTAVVCLALVWAFLVGEHKDLNIKAIKILKHGRRTKLLVKYGLEEFSNVLMRPIYKPKFDVFKFLSCT